MGITGTCISLAKGVTKCPQSPVALPITLSRKLRADFFSVHVSSSGLREGGRRGGGREGGGRRGREERNEGRESKQNSIYIYIHAHVYTCTLQQ